MNAILLIARRELGAYFRSWTGYIIIAAVLVLDGLLFNAFALGSGMDHKSSDVLAQFFYFSSGVTMSASVFISMRLLAGERESGTVNLLYSSPVRDYEIVIGKYLSALGFLAVLLAASVYMPLMVMVAGKISFGHVFVGYLGLFLLGSAAIAIGTLGSALTRSQILSVILSAVMVVALLTMWWVGRVTDRPLSTIFENLALWQIHFAPFMQGIVHLRDIVFYLAITYVALFAATRVLEARRWR
jgi:ABC-2 type transport system permease protein